MKIWVEYEDTNNTYQIPLDKLLKQLKLTPEQLQKAILKLLQES